MRKNWDNPIIFFEGLGPGGDGSDSGKGSGEYGIEEFAPTFEEWCSQREIFDPGMEDWEAYVAWMTEHEWAGFIDPDEMP